MILVLANIESTEGAIDEMKAAIAAMEIASQAEAGCISYRFTQELSHPHKMIVVEQWQSVDALVEHFAAPHMAAFGEAMAKNPPVSVDAKMYDMGPGQPLPGRD